MPVKKKLPKRKLTLKTQLFIKYLTDTEQLDKEGKRTFGNQTRSYALAYGRAPDQVATVNGSRSLTNANVQSELEALADSMEIGVKVRMRTLKNVAAGRTSRTTTAHQYSIVDGKRKLTAVSETTVPTRDADSIRAIQVINRMTGLDAMQAGIQALAIREAKDIYDRIVRPRSREQRVNSGPKPVSEGSMVNNEAGAAGFLADVEAAERSNRTQG